MKKTNFLFLVIIFFLASRSKAASIDWAVTPIPAKNKTTAVKAVNSDSDNESNDGMDVHDDRPRHQFNDELNMSVLNEQRATFSQFSNSPKQNINKILENSLLEYLPIDLIRIVQDYAGRLNIPVNSPKSPKGQLERLLNGNALNREICPYKFPCGHYLVLNEQIDRDRFNLYFKEHKEESAACKKFN